mgnify:CR=1 FL=1
MPRAKHNKKRNTAFLYEMLVRQLTKSIMEKDDQKRVQITSLIKESFHKTEVLGQELKHYDTLLETSDLKPHIAEKLLQEVKYEHSRLDQEEIFEKQSRLIGMINKHLSKEVWTTFVPNYKSIATISAIFNTDTSTKQRVLFEEVVVDQLSDRPANAPQEDLKPIDNIVYHSFVKNFNETYSELHEEQRDLLNRYIVSFADNGLELKIFLNEELGRLKGELNEALSNAEFEADREMSTKAKDVISLLDGYKKSPISETLVNKILKVQELVREINLNDN